MTDTGSRRRSVQATNPALTRTTDNGRGNVNNQGTGLKKFKERPMGLYKPFCKKVRKIPHSKALISQAIATIRKGAKVGMYDVKNAGKKSRYPPADSP